MKIAVLFNHYKQSKKKIAMLEAKLCYLSNSPIIKVSKHGFVVKGTEIELEVKYNDLMEQKQRLEHELWQEKGKTFAIETALVLLKEKDKFDHEILSLRYMDEKSLSYISDIKGYSRSTILKRLRSIEQEFEKTLAFQREIEQ